MDTMIRALLAEDTAKLIAIDGREMVETARKTHGLSRVATAALGRTLMAACMMGTQLKGEHDKLTTVIKGGGPLGRIVCTARPNGHVKGYVEDPAVELPPTPEGKLDVSMAVGWFGDLTVIRDMGMKEPYVGRCNLVSGEIAEDFAQYFTASEQQPSLVYLGVHVRPASGEVLSAAGLILQPLPGCPEETLDALTESAEGVKALAGLLEAQPLEQSLKQLFQNVGIRVTESDAPAFCCDCSRERLEQVLISMGREELSDMIAEDHGAELTCQFCNKRYAFSEAELTRLLASALAPDDKDKENG